VGESAEAQGLVLEPAAHTHPEIAVDPSSLERLREPLQTALQRLGKSPFPLGRIELQVTASNDGDYSRLHRDSDGRDTRELSFVYFFHREPRRFSGGELRIYPTRLVDGRLQPADHAQTKTPGRRAPCP
jgi:Rps23 Pro-64 3,4-dihydroxylase Tpa1-like proline 4-hydroxylase